jgi:multiple sugar transport system permease protein
VARVLLPQVVLAIPQYLLLARVGLTDSYFALILPQLSNPYGIYLSRIHAAAAVPDPLPDAGRIDGASEARLFRSIVLPRTSPHVTTPAPPRSG